MVKKNYNELKKISKNSIIEEGAYKVALLGDCATQHLCIAIRGICVEKKMNVEIWEADYNQIFAQIFDDQSDLYSYNPSVVILYISSEKLLEKYQKLENTEKYEFASRTMDNILSYWDKLVKLQNVKIIQLQFVDLDDKVYGNYASKQENSFIYNIRKLQCMLMENACKYHDVYIMDLNSIQSILGRNILFDEKLYYLAKMPISIEALPIVAERIVDILEALQGKIKKCVICDLDNTLWGGIIAEDGVRGIQIGELGTGRAFTDLQRWLKALKERGILLAVCSKNDEVIARKAFKENPYMVLRIDDFAVFVANWEDKASNIKNIQSILNIGFDSMVFLDDSSFERNLIRTLIPEVAVPDLPEDPALYLKYLRELNLFETVSVSGEDAKRTKQYQEEAQRRKIQKTFLSYQDYLENLEMLATVREFDELHAPRIAQLTQRSNQFNLRTTRYTEAEIIDLIYDDDFITRYYELEDRFGEHGLIGIAILEKRDVDTLFIETFLMSCRVLKRGMEEFIINNIIHLAKGNGFRRIYGEYIPTKKNGMVKELFANMGFEQCDLNKWVVDVVKFKDNNTKIKEKNYDEK